MAPMTIVTDTVTLVQRGVKTQDSVEKKNQRCEDTTPLAATCFDQVTSGLWAPRAATAPCC